MSLFRWIWMRRFVRKNTKPIDLDTAEKWKKRLSFAYAIAAWQAIGVVGYLVYKGKGDWAESLKTEEELQLTPAQHYIKQLNIEGKGKIIRMKSFSKVSETEFDTNEES